MIPTKHISIARQGLKLKASVFIVVMLFLALALYYLNVNPILIFSDFHNMGDLLEEMWPPHYQILWTSSSMAFSILQTLSMAFLGTVYGVLIASMASVLSASNIMPLRFVRTLVRLLVSFFRVVPSLVIILVFVIAVGPGAFAGVLTLILTTIGTFGKLFTEVLENTDMAAADALYAIGATRVQVIRYCIFPQVFPAFISNLFYSFDINMRAAIGLGIFGGGGIGYKLYMAMRVLHHRDAAALITCIIVLVLAVEGLSNYLRAKLIPQ